ncbi:MAG: hypothetical protein DRO14_03250 [Thermoprotei archaeon]|nr:MAG: hypothetical protein DRO14_03250 [Thermoprotei archaeon]
MIKLHECGRGCLYRVLTLEERRKFRFLMNKYNAYGHLSQAPYLRRRMDLVYCIGEDWCVLFTIHLMTNPTILTKYRLDWDRTWFIRRVATIEECREKYGHVTVEAHQCLIDWLRKRGESAVIALVVTEDVRRSGATYKRLGFQEVGRTVRGKGRWFLLRLKE